MSIKKLTLAATISVMVSIGIVQMASAQDSAQSGNSSLSAPASVTGQKPSAYGVGAAGSFKAYGTFQPYGGNSSGATEISGMRSPTSLPNVGTAALAAQGCYGECPPCQSSTTTGGAAGVTPASPSVVTIQKEVTNPGETGGASSVDQTISTPTNSNFTGGASAAENQGYKCVEPSVNIPQAVTGAATTPCPACVPGATCGQGNAVAPSGFEQPKNPNINAYDQNGNPTGGACPATPAKKHHWWQFGHKCQQTTQPCPVQTTGTPSGGASAVTCPAPATCPVMQQPMNSIPIQSIPCPQQNQSAAPCTAPQQACVPVQLCPIAPSISSNLIPYNPCQRGPVTDWQITGGASTLNNPATSNNQCTLNNKSGNSSQINTAGYAQSQSYAYPAIPKSSASYVAANGQILSLGEQCNSGITVFPRQSSLSANPYAVLDPQASLTGAASPIVAAGGCNPGAPALSGAQVLRKTAVNSNPVKSISIQSPSSMTLQRVVLVPVDLGCTGAAANISGQFSDVAQNSWAGNAINKLASNGVISGFPDRTFKPNLPVSRAEFSSMLVNALNLQNSPAFYQQIFKDVPNNYWASRNIDRAYNNGLVNGYPNDTYQPNAYVSRAEALTTISRALPTSDLSAYESMAILNQYSDGNQVPTWATIPVAKSLKSGVLQSSQNPNIISPNQNATRADIASMLSQLRQYLSLEPQPRSSTGAAAALQQQTVTVPSINVKFNDRISARASHVGDKFTATTMEQVSVDGMTFPQGSIVSGRISEVVRPSAGCNGALKLSFNNISSTNQSSELPREVIVAQVQTNKQPNLAARAAEAPLVWAGRVLGVTGRTVGGATVIAGNSVEQVFNNGGLAVSEVISGDYSGAGRNGIGSALALGGGIIDITKTALSGAAGLFNVTTDEVAFLTSPNGNQIADINPKEE